jgi:hypothetical protein
LNSKHLYTHGPARIFQRNFSNGDKGTLCVELSYELSERIKEKVEASRHVRALNAAAAQRSEDLLNEELRIAALQGERHRELVEFVTAIEAADRAHTDDEQAKATAMGAKIQKGNEQRRCLKDEREYLPVYMQHFRAKWVALARDVEVLEEDILTSCKLLPEFDDKTELPWKHRPGKPRQPSLNPKFDEWPFSVPRTERFDVTKAPAPDPDESIRARIIFNERSKRHAWQAAREQHDNYRKEYGGRLQYYIDQQVDRPGIDFQEEFSKYWLEGWHDRIRELDEAEKAFIKAQDEARAENVTVFDLGDDQEPNFNYDIDWWDRKSLEQLDRSLIEKWNAGVIVGAFGPEQPFGMGEAERERQAGAEKLGQPAKEGVDAAVDVAPTMTPSKLSAVRADTTTTLPAHTISCNTHTALDRIVQILVGVEKTLGRASELTGEFTGEQADESSPVGQTTRREDTTRSTEQTRKVTGDFRPSEPFVGPRCEDSQADATKDTLPSSSQPPKTSRNSTVEQNSTSPAEDQNYQHEKPDASGLADTNDVSSTRSGPGLAATEPTERKGEAGLESSTNAMLPKDGDPDSSENTETHHQLDLTDLLTQNATKVTETPPKRKRTAIEEEVAVEPQDRMESEAMDWKRDMSLEDYMEKYKVEPPPVSKKRNPDNVRINREFMISTTERIYGYKRRRIDEWGNKVRGGDC